MQNPALIVVDAQKIYTDRNSELYCRDADKTLEKINRLIDGFQKQKQLIVYVRHVHKEDASDLGRMFDFAGDDVDEFNFKANSEEVKFDAALKLSKNPTTIVKNRYSAFQNTQLDGILRSNKITKVVICGFMTNFCCESTARDAHDRDYYVDFIIDATGTPGTDKYSQKDIRDIVGELLGAGFATVKRTDTFLRSAA